MNGALGAHPALERMHPTWAKALTPVEPQIHQMLTFLQHEAAAGRPYAPSEENIFAAFTRPLDQVRVLLVGQDPYPTPGHAVGLSFSVDKHVQPLPRSLKNIYTELHDDLGVPLATHGDLSMWADAGVLLLNRVLSVEHGQAGSHQRQGWEAITDRAISALVARGGPLVAILWGRQAQTLKPQLRHVPVIESAHPSPLSARRGFFGSAPFSSANELLVAQGGKPLDWRVG